MKISLLSVCLAFFAAAATADTFYVETGGQDADDRDGKAPQMAWKSLAYACERVDAGEHTIQLGAGTFVAERTAKPASGVTIAGQGREGEKATRVVASIAWKLADMPCEGNPVDEYLINIERVENVALRDMTLASTPEHRITGAVHCRGAKQVEMQNLHLHDFRWNGLRLDGSQHLDIHHCRIENASTDKCRYHGGLVSTRWIKNSELHHNEIVSTVGEGYGYKGGGHEGVRLHHNLFDVVSGFAIESAHENEFGLQIDHNYANRCISVPKGGQGADPNERGYEYSVWIHHNLLTDSYTVEGPRNHLRLSHNHIRIEKPGGRVYTHHGGINHGPVWIHHNTVENLDRAFVWMNQGLAENIFVYNNTVFCADAGDRSGAIFGAYTTERLNHWVVKNNIFVAPADHPRKLMDDKRGVPEKIAASGNVCIHITGLSEGNLENVELGLKLSGEKPWPFFAAADEKSPLVDRGSDVGLPFSGKSPDIGAFELGEEQRLDEIPRQ